MGVQRTPRFGAESERFDLTKIQLSSKLSPKVQKKLARKFVWRRRMAGEIGVLPITNSRRLVTAQDRDEQGR